MEIDYKTCDDIVAFLKDNGISAHHHHYEIMIHAEGDDVGGIHPWLSFGERDADGDRTIQLIASHSIAIETKCRLDHFPKIIECLRTLPFKCKTPDNTTR